MIKLPLPPRTRHVTIAYYGPCKAGKSANFQSLSQHWPASAVGRLISEATESTRRLSLGIYRQAVGDTAPILFQLVTAPGAVLYERVRTQVLEEAQGVVFIADSQRDKLQENVRSLKELSRALIKNGRNLSKFPIILQYNKRDLPGALDISVLEKYLNPIGWQAFEASAAHNRGVLETFEAIAAKVAAAL